MKVLLVGFGVVGEGIAKILIEKNVGIKIIGICEIDYSIQNPDGLYLEEILDLKKSKGTFKSHPKAEIGKNAQRYIKELSADVVVDVTPTNIDTGEPTLSHIKDALCAKKHVVTSSKGPLALHYRELKDLSKKNNVKFLYEATVGGCIPIMVLARSYFKCNTFKSIYGIVNGTTNYILTRMTNENAQLDQVLLEAQQLGIAEKDASYDIDGIDTACKIVILANEYFNMNVTYKDVCVKGIRTITPEFLQIAKKKGFAVKLIGSISDQKIDVAPKLIPISHPLNVSGVYNAITIKTDYTDDITLIGYGAGKLETASAVVNDILSI